MFLFYHTLQNGENDNYYKGILFEELLKLYLMRSGYDIELRKKHNSLEYDLEGTLRTTKQKLIGEAKAHSKSMAGQVISAFVGKLLPLGLISKDVHGLFLSLSPLTPEAGEYYNSIKAMGVTAKTGLDLYSDISNALHLPSDIDLEKRITQYGYDLIAPNILKTESGLYKLLILKKRNSGTPSCFAVFNSNGEEIVDDKFSLRLIEKLPELSGLEFMVFNSENNVDSVGYKREILQGLSVGTDWSDYRLPAGPAVFVGRKDFLGLIENHIKSNEMPHVIQVKSRSGVGKSSIIAFLEKRFSISGLSTELHDSRDVKTVYDIFSLIARFTKKRKIPKTYIEIDEFLNHFQNTLDGKQAIFFVDQFESTFVNPDIFNCYEYIANSITKINKGIYMVLARKNDQLTTYDDTKVSLNRINSISKSYTLPDFERSESILLLEKINESDNYILSKEILPYIIEFAQGFPWLLKRTIAHVLKLAKRGESQRDLIGAGLKLNDLFEEELEGLDEIEKDYLTKIAAKLPADFKELQYQFDEDPMLVKVLDKLTTSRLVRLSGSTYDTYNDVFKEYLVYQKLPEFRQLIIYRMYPGSVVNQFHKIVKLVKIDIEKIKKELDVSEGYAFNLIKEFRNFDLLEAAKSGGWIIPAKVLDIYSQGQLTGYLRRKIMDNDLVEGVIGKIISGKTIFESDLPSYFSSSYPFIEASDKTWRLYSTILKSWLLTLKIIEITKDGNLQITNYNHMTASNELGNLTQISGAKGESRGLFFPITSLLKMNEIAKKLLNDIEIVDKEGIKAKTDLKNAGLLVNGQLAVASSEELNEALYAQLLDDGYNELWMAIKNKRPHHDIFRKMIGGNLTESTLEWRMRKLISLAKNLDIIPKNKTKSKNHSEQVIFECFQNQDF